MAFPADPLDVKVDLRLAGVWTDVTSDVFGGGRDQVDITRGRRSEGGRASPTECRLSLDNTSGDYSPRNPLASTYGQLGRNTQLRVSTGTAHVGAGGGSGAATTSHVAPSVTATGAGLLVCGWLADDPVNYTPPGGMTAGPETDGTYSTLGIGYEAVSAGATGTRTATASTGEGYVSVSAVLHGTSVTVQEALSGVSDTIQDVTLTTDAATEVGWWLVAVQGWVRGSDVSPPDAPYGDDGGWILLGDAPMVEGVFDGTFTTYLRLRIWARRVNFAGAQQVVFAGVAQGSPGAADNQAALLVLSGVDDWNVRATVEVPAWPPRWDVTGADVWVPITAQGITRRLGQGSSPLWSPLRRALTGAAGTQQVGRDLLPVDYWPFEDGPDASGAASGLPGHVQLRSWGPIGWGQVSSPGSADLPDWSSSTFAASGPVVGVGGVRDWSVGCLIQASGTTAWTALVVVVASGVYGEIRLALTSSATTVQGISDSGTTTLATVVETVMDGDPHWVEMRETESGGVVTHGLWIDGSLAGSSTDSGSQGRPVHVRVQPRSADPAGLGHLAVFADPVAATYALILAAAIAGHAGETAGRRVERLCREEGIPVHVVGDPDRSTPMGVQPAAQLMGLLRECEDADGGILYEPREVLGLAYRCSSARYHQPVTAELTYGAAGEVSPPLEPTDDDRDLRNDVTASRRQGSSARHEVTSGPLSTQDPPDGVGVYDTAVTVNVADDGQLPSQASWRAHLGTWDEARYPLVRVNLAALGDAGKTALMADVVALDCGDRLTIADTPPWLPPGPVDQHVEGYAETLAQFVWDMRLVCSPAGPWQVFVVEDPVFGRLDTGGSELALAVNDADTELLVATDAGSQPWITTARPADFPFTLNLGGEVVEVSAISGDHSPQTFTVERSVNGIVKGHPAGTRLRIASVAVS